jgi:hypothetical protein
MAGIKITELPSIGTLEKDDLTYVVDVSTDTSKQATIQNIIDVVDQLSITDVDGQAIIIAESSEGIKVQGVQGYFQGLKYRADYSPEYAPLSLIARQDAPKIFALSGKPTNTSTIANNYGDIYVDTGTGSAYIANNITSDLDWTKINDFTSAVGTPTLQGGIPPVPPITLGQCFYSKVGNYVSVKGVLEITFSGGGAGQSVSFNISLPYGLGSGNVFNATNDVIGSINPNGIGAVNHKINYLELRANTGNDYVYIYVDVDNQVNGVCQFVYDYGYFIP